MVANLQSIISELQSKSAYTSQDIVSIYRLRQTQNSFRYFVTLLIQDLLQTGDSRSARAYKTLYNKIITSTKGNIFL